jgi:hypothetical protein
MADAVVNRVAAKGTGWAWTKINSTPVTEFKVNGEVARPGGPQYLTACLVFSQRCKVSELTKGGLGGLVHRESSLSQAYEIFCDTDKLSIPAGEALDSVRGSPVRSYNRQIDRSGELEGQGDSAKRREN